MPRISEATRRKRAPGPGYSVLGAAKKTGIPEGRIRRAVAAGEVETVKFGNTERLPLREVERLAQLYR